MDTAASVNIAKTWVNAGEQLVYTSPMLSVGKAIPYSTSLTSALTMKFTVTAEATKIAKLEHVQVHVKLSATRRGNIAISLLAPSGTPSTLLTPRYSDWSGDGMDWTFMTLRNWDESPVGEWVLYVRNAQSNYDTGNMVYWQLTLYGTEAVSSCSVGTYQNDTAGCLPCHGECGERGCFGAGPDDCYSCKHFQQTTTDGILCVADCDKVMMLNPTGTTGECLSCDPMCLG